MKKLLAAALVATALTAAPALANTETCTVDNEPGFVMYDGTCMTPTRYDATFSLENLATIEDQTGIFDTVADIVEYNQVDVTVAPSQRERLIGNQVLPSFATLVGNHTAI